MKFQVKYWHLYFVVGFFVCAESRSIIEKRSFNDLSIKDYLTERTCWWNEICKEEFQTLFRCKCPMWSYCRSPGRYYNAFCTMTGTGYIWTQPELSWGTLQKRGARTPRHHVNVAAPNVGTPDAATNVNSETTSSTVTPSALNATVASQTADNSVQEM